MEESIWHLPGDIRAQSLARLYPGPLAGGHAGEGLILLPKQKLSASLQQNLAYLQQIFGASSDFYTKKLTLGQIPCAIVLFTGLSSPEKLWVMALDALERCPLPTRDGRQLFGIPFDA